MRCVYCGSDQVGTASFRRLADGKYKQRYRCKRCKRRFSKEDPFVNPKVLYFDIETSPIEAYTWNLGKAYITPEFVKEDWFVLAWAAKWLCDDAIFSSVVTPREVKNRNDKRILKNLWVMLEEADIVVGHNARRFDIRKVNWRFLLHGLRQPSPYQTVDTLVEARRYFGASSNKLDWLARQLGVGGKVGNRPGLWQDCMAGDTDALRTMREYNENDILIGEGVYLKMRPWMRTHPNMGLYYETDSLRCRNCGSDNITQGGTYNTPATVYVSWRCECGAVGRTDVKLTKRKPLLK